MRSRSLSAAQRTAWEAPNELSARRGRNVALVCGGVARPLFTIVGLAQAFTRDGFDLRDHTLSLLSNGDLGWLQIVNFVISGSLIVVASTGIRAALASARGRRWGPFLVGAFGVGMVAAGCFVADPAYGFPPGTPGGNPRP